MTWQSITLALLLTLGCGAASCPGVELCRQRSWWTATFECCCPPLSHWCADDYCRKPLPCIPCLPRNGTCDDYCRPPLPCLPCLPRCGTCDDYCRKTLPCSCPAPRGDFVCVSGCGGCPACQAGDPPPVKSLVQPEATSLEWNRSSPPVEPSNLGDAP